MQPQQPAYGAPQGGWQQPPHGGGNDPLGNLAGRLPGSAPGTIFGIPIARLRDPSLEAKLLMVAGIALLASIFIPLSTSPTVFVWDGPKFKGLVWPIIAGLSYLLVAFAPASLRQSIPPVVMKWLPFGIAFASIILLGVATILTSSSATMRMYGIGYAVLVFGLLARLANPQDQWARYVIGAGVVLILPGAISFIVDVAFEFKLFPGLFIVHNLLFVVVLLVALAAGAFVIPPHTVPALRSVDAFAPLVTAILLLWLPVQWTLMLLVQLVHAKAGIGAFLAGAHELVAILAYFGVLMVTAPEAYDKAKELIAGGGRPGGPGGPGGYPDRWQQPPHGQPPQGGWQQPQQPQGGWQQPQQPQQPQGGWQQPPPGGQGGGWPPQGGQGQ
jgi:hypothetical protein